MIGHDAFLAGKFFYRFANHALVLNPSRPA